MKYIVKIPQGASYDYTLDDIKKEFAAGTLREDCRVRRADSNEWTSLGELFGRNPAERKSRNPPADAICYLLRGDQQHGPYSTAQIRNMWAAGQITVDTLYWFEGLSDWFPARNFCERNTLAPEANSEQTKNPDSFGLVVVLTILLPIVGLIAGIAWLCDPKQRSAGGSILAIALILMLIYGMIFSSFLH